MERFAPKPSLIISGPHGEYKQPRDLADRVTATQDVFVISHMGVADVEKINWRLQIAGLVDKELSITFEDLRRFSKRTLESIHKCAGNPREPTIPTRQIANVRWGGVDVRELIDGLGVHIDASHLWAYGLEYGSFIGVDQEHYLKDIPRSRVDEGDVLIAYELNGEPLSAKHGAPARLIVPGFYGTNCVKWLYRLEFQDRRADSLFTRVLYNDRDLVSDPSGHAMKPVWMVEPESIIVSPGENDDLAASQMEIWGWAWSNCSVQSVEVSVDGGRVWQEAAVEPRHQYSWQKFSFEWTPDGRGSFKIYCRATDVAGITQPMDGARNAVHSISVNVE